MMRIFNFTKKQENPSLALSSTLAVSLATLTATHLNAARDIMSKKEQNIARQAAWKLSEARKRLHTVERALQVRDQERAMHLVNEVSKGLQEYYTLTAPIVKLGQVRKDVEALKLKLADLEKRVMFDRI